jgi:hypothetical protein
MAYAPAKLYRGTPTTGSTTLYTASGNVIVKSIVVTNTTTAAATITLNIGTVAILSAVSVAANSTLVVESGELEVMANTETITGLQGTASALTVRILGVTF